MFGSSPPVWEEEAERVGIELRRMIVEEIASDFDGDVGQYVLRKFGLRALESIFQIAETQLQRADPDEDDEPGAIIAALLLRYAVNRAAFRVVTEKAGYGDIDPDEDRPATGNESIAVMTRNGSMVFGSTGCLKMVRGFYYLPLDGRQIRPAYRTGLIVPAWQTKNAEQHRTLRFHQGFVPVPGQVVTVPGPGRHPWRTSQLIEVRLKEGTPDDPIDWQETQEAIHSMVTLNLGFGDGD